MLTLFFKESMMGYSLIKISLIFSDLYHFLSLTLPNSLLLFKKLTLMKTLDLNTLKNQIDPDNSNIKTSLKINLKLDKPNSLILEKINNNPFIQMNKEI